MKEKKKMGREEGRMSFVLTPELAVLIKQAAKVRDLSESRWLRGVLSGEFEIKAEFKPFKK